ncbi:hypothetical protein NBRC116188_12970 [Oceaniserpentilla sp. 4NH20-0058]|uniref:CLCA_X family protein n=1 Tax=Oceaniserpentilla sp. 4NH20-0058 TaxID=3127660 RepID=UPI00310307DF
MLHREFYRRGPNHQLGEAVSFASIRQRFDFRSIQIGKWVKEAEKQKAAPLFYDALCDLMTILGGNESLISLRGTLALQYGCGGQPGVMAHYEPSTRSFSLAKNAGPGSIAHEWFHGFDHYICHKAFTGAAKGDFASNAWLDDVRTIEHPLNELLGNCYQTIILNEAATEPSDYFKKSAEVDKQVKGYYYSKPEELCARAFEAFVQDASIKNNFLVKGTKESEEAKLGLYPQGEHRQNINNAFRHYFSSLGQALKQQSTLNS